MHESLVTAKSVVDAPLSLIETDETVSAPANAPLLLLVTVTATGVAAVPASWLEKLTLGGSEIDASVAVPDSATVEGVAPGRLNVADRALGVVPDAGLKVTAIWQLLPAAIVVHGDGVGTEKSAAFVPVTATGLTPAATLLPFVTVTGCDALDVPSLCGPNVKLAGVAVSVGAAVAMPLRATCCGLPLASSLKLRLAFFEPAV